MKIKSQTLQPQYWGLIPAAGIGVRMGKSTPKQFMNLGCKTLLEWSVHSLAAHHKVNGVCIGLSQQSGYEKWAKTIDDKVTGTFCGGATRTHTVLNGLMYLLGNGVSRDDWVLVHDSNRPFLSLSDITALIEQVGQRDDGGLLCAPIHDTVKFGSEGRVIETYPRDSLFRALTPQMFKAGILEQSLRNVLNSGLQVTDESQAVEELEYQPVIVTGQVSNIKITTCEDLELATQMIPQFQSENNISEQT